MEFSAGPLSIQRSERFEAAFNRIHKRLLELMPNTEVDRFTYLVREGSKRHAMIKTYADELYQFAKLRNAIVHEKVNTHYYIAEPHDNVVNRIEQIAMHLLRPKYALHISTRPVLYFHEETLTNEVLQAIATHGYTQFPIYDRSGVYLSLLTSNGIIQWMAANMDGQSIHFSKVQVKDLLSSEQGHNVMFIPKSSNIFDVENRFEEYHIAGKKLEAILITENGLPYEQPLGIITSWDLVEIDLID